MANTGGVYTWSQTASANATADNTVNWSEGQAPSTINDSGRAMMTAVAKYRDDISGMLVTTGTATAYILSSNQNFDSAADMHLKTIAFSPHVTNGPNPKITIDGIGPITISLPPGFLVPNLPYVWLYNQTANQLYLQNSQGSGLVPIGTIIDFAGPDANIPGGYLACDGQAISRTTYAALFAAISTTWGSGDGSTTFNVPTLTSRYRRHRDNSTLAGAVGTVQNPANLAHTHTYSGTTSGENANHTHSMNFNTSSESVAHTHTFSGETGGMDANNPHSHAVTSSALAIENGTGSGIGGGGSFGLPTPPQNFISIVATDINHGHPYSGTTSGESALHVHNVNGSTGIESVAHAHTFSGTTSGGSADNANEARPYSATVLAIIRAQ